MKRSNLKPECVSGKKSLVKSKRTFARRSRFIIELNAGIVDNVLNTSRGYAFDISSTQKIAKEISDEWQTVKNDRLEYKNRFNDKVFIDSII